MARRTRTTPSSPTEPKQPGIYTKYLSSSLFYSVAITMIIGGTILGIGKYIEFNSPGPYDSGAYVYSAKHLLEGARLGVDEKPAAQPCTLLANIIGVKLFGFNDVGPKIIQMMFQLAGLIFMFYTLYKVFGPTAAAIGTILGAVYLSAPLIAKFGNVKEQFMIPFMIATACCWIHYECSQKRLWLVLCGFFGILPYYFKPTGLSITIALVLYLVIQGLFEKNLRAFILRIALLFIGACAGLCIPASLFVWQGQMNEFWHTTPVALIKMAIVLSIILIVGTYLIKTIIHYRLLNQFKSVSLTIWVAGAISAIIMLTCCIFYVKSSQGYLKGDISSYIHSIPFIALVNKCIAHLTSVINMVLYKAGVGQNGYLANSRAAIAFSDLWPKVLRYYKALSVPIIFALLSIAAASAIWLGKLIKKTRPAPIQTHVVWLLAIWWILDMAFVWISPRSYEQYYLPLCGSAAVLSGFGVWAWSRKLKAASFKIPWIVGGTLVITILGYLSLPIFIGQRYSPDTGTDYLELYKRRSRGFAQSLETVKKQGTSPWQNVGDYIKAHSTENDEIYVWGWIPGIYVQAQRLSPATTAFFSDMHVTSPARLEYLNEKLVQEFEETPPKFIVDSRKRHIPWNRLPLELWPIVPKGLFGNENAYYLRNIPQEIAAFDTSYGKMLQERYGTEEADRYKAMKPLRDYVMRHYRPVNSREFGEHRLYERIENLPSEKP